MKVSSRVALALIASLFLAAGCGDNDGKGTSQPTPTITSTPAPTPTPITFAGHLDLDIRKSADIELRVSGSDLTATVTLNDSRGVATAGVALEGAGSVETFPEAAGILYTARLSSAAVADGRCGSEPTSLALTLFRRGGNDRVAGGIAAYCGADTYTGIPARMLRLAGPLTAK